MVLRTGIYRQPFVNHPFCLILLISLFVIFFANIQRTPKPLTELNHKVEVRDSTKKRKKYVPRVLKLENEITKFEKKNLCAEKENKENKAPSPVRPKRQQPSNARALSLTARSQQPYMDMTYFHGEGWLKKQDAAFTAWLNFILRDAKKV